MQPSQNLSRRALLKRGAIASGGLVLGTARTETVAAQGGGVGYVQVTELAETADYFVVKEKKDFELRFTCNSNNNRTLPAYKIKYNGVNEEEEETFQILPEYNILTPRPLPSGAKYEWNQIRGCGSSWKRCSFVEHRD